MLTLAEIRKAVADVLATVAGVNVVNLQGYYPALKTVTTVGLVMPPFGVRSIYGFASPRDDGEPDYQSHVLLAEFWCLDTGNPDGVIAQAMAVGPAVVGVLLAHQEMTVTGKSGIIRLGFFDGDRFDYTIPVEVDEFFTQPVRGAKADTPTWLVVSVRVPVHVMG